MKREGIIYWLDKKVTEINRGTEFKKYFNEAEYEKVTDTYNLTNEEKGIGLVLSLDFEIETIHLYNEESSKFTDPVPLGLKFAMSRSAILEIFGRPFRAEPRHTNIHLGEVNAWDKYLLNDFSLRIEYNTNQTEIFLITLASLKLENYLNAKMN